MADIKESKDRNSSPDLASLDKNPSVQHIDHLELQHAVGTEGAKGIKEAGNGNHILSEMLCRA